MPVAQNSKGFSMAELMVVVGILAVVAVIAAPNIIKWRSNAKLRGAVQNLRGELQAAKASAARESCWVVVEFFGDRYRVFVDNGAGAGGNKNNNVLDGSERIIRERQLPAGVSIEPSAFTKTHFNPRGTTGAAGTLALVNKRGDRKKLIISGMGRIRIEDG
jgi:prepilin-type N-terminal cleavage/methylation domain-containing protein